MDRRPRHILGLLRVVRERPLLGEVINSVGADNYCRCTMQHIWCMRATSGCC